MSVSSCVDRQVDRGQVGQRGLARAQGDQRGAGLAHQVGGDQQVLRATRLGNADGHVAGLEGHRRHRLHVRVGVGRRRQQQAEELVLGIRGYRAGSAEAVELHALGVGDGGDGALQGVGVQVLADFHQAVQRGVEDLQAEVGHRVALMDRELAEAGAGRQALRQLQLEVLEAAAADGAAETHDGRLADPDPMGQFGHGLCMTDAGSLRT